MYYCFFQFTHFNGLFYLFTALLNCNRSSATLCLWRVCCHLHPGHFSEPIPDFFLSFFMVKSLPLFILTHFSFSMHIRVANEYVNLSKRVIWKLECFSALHYALNPFLLRFNQNQSVWLNFLQQILIIAFDRNFSAFVDIVFGEIGRHFVLPEATIYPILLLQTRKM